DTGSPPRLVLSARQTLMSMLCCTNRTLPSPISDCTPPVCRLRAAWMFHAPPLLTHGRFWAGWLLQFWVTMSGDVLFGPSTVVNCAPGAHQLNPRRSDPVPWTVSDASIVLLDPSDRSVILKIFGAHPNGAPPNWRATGVVMSTW